MYKIKKSIFDGGRVSGILRSEDAAMIPLDGANSDFARFKNEIQGIGENGQSITTAELQDADGNTMTEEEVAEFIATLP